MDASSGAGIFSTKPVPWLKEYLKQRGIQSSGKRKNELVELSVKFINYVLLHNLLRLITL